jgi:hypothetical protein
MNFLLSRTQAEMIPQTLLVNISKSCTESGYNRQVLNLKVKEKLRSILEEATMEKALLSIFRALLEAKRQNYLFT